MEYKNNNDVAIILHIKDPRGRKIRVQEVKDIKFKVWTERFDCALSFKFEDVVQKSEKDILPICGLTMEALQSGVVSYSYKYGVGEGKHRSEYEDTVVTDIFWKNHNRDSVISSPAFYHTVDVLNDKIDGEIKDRVKKDKEFEDYIEDKYWNSFVDEVERAKSEENRIETTLDEKITKVDEKLFDEIKRANEVDINLFKYIKEIEEKQSGDNSSTNDKLEDTTTNLQSEIERAQSEEKRIEDKLDEEILRSTNEDNQTGIKIESETTRAKGEEARIEALVEIEKNRAQFVEKNLQDNVDEITTTLQTVKQTTNDNRDKLEEEISTRTLEDNKINALIDILNGSEFQVGSVAHSIKDALHLLKEEIDGEVGDTYATKEEVVERITRLINEAPEAYDTLGEIAEKLKEDSDIIKTLKEILTGKAEKEDVYTRQEIDRKEGDLRNELVTETQRAQFEEQNLKNLISVINGDESVIGSLLHILKDAKHYTDDEVEKFKLQVEEGFVARLEEVEDSLIWKIYD